MAQNIEFTDIVKKVEDGSSTEEETLFVLRYLNAHQKIILSLLESLKIEKIKQMINKQA
jgi:hypothetical protein